MDVNTSLTTKRNAGGAPMIADPPVAVPAWQGTWFPSRRLGPEARVEVPGLESCEKIGDRRIE